MELLHHGPMNTDFEVTHLLAATLAACLSMQLETSIKYIKFLTGDKFAESSQSAFKLAYPFGMHEDVHAIRSCGTLPLPAIPIPEAAPISNLQRS